MKNLFKMIGFKIKENKYRVFLILLVLLLLSGWFYWFEIRSVNIRSTCSRYALERSKTGYNDRHDPDVYNFNYARCKHQYGVN